VAALGTARELGRDLAASGLVVVSGLALGVDAAAHQGALDHGTTVAVLGTGIDVTYPRDHEALARRIASSGAVLSEFPPGTPPRRPHFPRRNRLVAGLALGVVVVEAGESSGALITAHAALDQGKEVMVVPGAALAGRNRGGHGLIKDGAALVENAADVLAVLGRRTPAPAARQGSGRTAASSVLPPGVSVSWKRGEELELESVVQLTGMTPHDALVRLLEWELAGAVARTSSGAFVRL
jgi:DNA processing protein